MPLIFDMQEQRILYWLLGNELTASEVAEQLQISPAEYANVLQNIREKLTHSKLLAAPWGHEETRH